MQLSVERVGSPGGDRFTLSVAPNLRVRREKGADDEAERRSRLHIPVLEPDAERALR